jgi:hypothetical protein
MFIDSHFLQLSYASTELQKQNTGQKQNLL